MTADADDPWLRTLTLRLQSHYGDRDEAEARARLGAALRDRLATLSAAASAARYLRLEPIAAGGMGLVWNAHDTLFDREVALKLVADGEAGPQLRLRLLREAERMARLQHPGIVAVHDLGLTDDGAPFFVMQRIAGDSLGTLLARGDGGRDVAAVVRFVEVLRRACDTVAFAHAHGVVHRDLKPDNLMVGAFGEVYVLDWGLAVHLDDADDGDAAAGDAVAADATLTAAGTVVGTPAYMAPERLAGDGRPVRATPAFDVYGLGAVLYEILTGMPPYASEAKVAGGSGVLRAIRDRAPLPVLQLAPHADPELAAICARAMARDPAARYRDPRALGAELRAWTEHRVVEAHGAGLWRHLRKWLRRNRTTAATVAVAATVLAIASLAFVQQLRTARNEARAAAATATTNLRELEDLAIVQNARDLRQRADRELWPLDPAHDAATAAWLAEAELLRPAAARLRARRAAPDTHADADAAMRSWRRALLDEAIAELDAFFAPAADGGGMPLDATVTAVAARPAAARALADASLNAAAARAAWDRALAYLAEAPVYRGVSLVPQLGLLPLGPDPATGLLEFAHLQTGAPAERGADGALHPRAEDGVVLVLLPGGTFPMGAAADDPIHPDPLAEPINEQPVRAVALGPFFVAKYEFTQAQWQRATGGNPSVHGARSIYVDDTAAARHPVESVDWWQARTVLFRLGLALPTEAQWEYAARAGTTTPWYAGSTPADLLSPPAGNLADATSAAELGTQGWLPTAGLRDGFVMHAPVGSFAPNAFGLFDVIGNVAEWCDDEYRSYSIPTAPDTGARPQSESPTTVIYRGGAFDQPAAEARSANRAGDAPTHRAFDLGLRAARRLVR